VGCNACVVGCSIENGTKIPLNWRVVNSANLIKHPDLPVFHYSLACNHCEEAPCMNNCPALAYSRDEKTGAVIHHAEACIGCKYCTWACPYDAPKFNPETRIVEKCNFCVDRINEGEKPACTVACPVGALDFGQPVLNKENYIQPGFVNTGIKPSIQLIPLRDNSKQTKTLGSEKTTYTQKIDFEQLPSKIQVRKEWTLLLFTLIAALLIGILPFSFNIRRFTSQEEILFVGMGILAMFLSSFHLGKKLRAWRSILNLKKSWLSREIFSFSGFIFFVALYFYLGIEWLAWSAMAMGVLSLISIDMVYKLTYRKDKLIFHSAMVWITGLLIFGLAIQSDFLIAMTLTAKITLYSARKYQLKRFSFLSILRLSGLIGLIVYWAISPFDIPVWLYLLLGLGELIDRAEFYHEIEIITPKSGLGKS